MNLGSVWCLRTGAPIVIGVGRLLNVSIKVSLEMARESVGSKAGCYTPAGELSP